MSYVKIGVGGPVGSGKTALIERLTREMSAEGWYLRMLAINSSYKASGLVKSLVSLIVMLFDCTSCSKRLSSSLEISVIVSPARTFCKRIYIDKLYFICFEKAIFCIAEHRFPGNIRFPCKFKSQAFGQMD